MDFHFGEWTRLEEEVRETLSSSSKRVTFPFPNEPVSKVPQKEEQHDPVVEPDNGGQGLCNGIEQMYISTSGATEDHLQHETNMHNHIQQHTTMHQPMYDNRPPPMVAPPVSVAVSMPGYMVERSPMVLQHSPQQHIMQPIMGSALNAGAKEFVPRFGPAAQQAVVPNHPLSMPRGVLHQPHANPTMTAAAPVITSLPMDAHPYQGLPVYHAANYTTPPAIPNRPPVPLADNTAFMLPSSNEMRPFHGLNATHLIGTKPQRNHNVGSHIPAGIAIHPESMQPVPPINPHLLNGPGPEHGNIINNSMYSNNRSRGNRNMQTGPPSTPPKQIQLLKRPQHGELTVNQTEVAPAKIEPNRASHLAADDAITALAVSEKSEPSNQIPYAVPSGVTAANTRPATNNSSTLPSGLSFGFEFVIDDLLTPGKSDAVQLLTGPERQRSKPDTPVKVHNKPNRQPVHAPVTPSPAVAAVPVHVTQSPPQAEVNQKRRSTETVVSSLTPTPKANSEPVKHITNGVSPPVVGSTPSVTTSPTALPTTTTPVASPPQPAAPKSWANLFSGGSPAGGGVRPGESSTVPSRPAEMPPPPVRPANDIGAIISSYKVISTAISLQARRLINQANWCYVNATLQALLACPPFYHVMKALPLYPALSSNQRSVTPVLDAMVEFVNEFHEMQYPRFAEQPSVVDQKGKQQRRRKDLKLGEPFEPSGIYNVLTTMKTADNTFQRGKQEDAEEFLTFILNKLHEEMGESIKQYKEKLAKEGLANGNGDTCGADSDHSAAESEDDGDEWEQVGPKNKSVVTHSNVDKNTTPISEIFGGLLRSSLSTGASSKESAVLEPFFTVPLNVQTNKTVEEALRAFVSKEVIDGYTCPQTKQETDAHRRLTFEQLPPILILHLKCFVYDKHGGSQKVLHNMDFSTTLEFEKELFSSQAKQKYLPKDKRSYRLFAVVYHLGNKTSGGHYHTDLFHIGVRNWVRFDDNSVAQIEERQVLDFKYPCVPYLLYYKRVDTITSAASNSGGVSSNKPGAHNNVPSR